MMFALHNLVSHSVTECTPWTFRGAIPESVRGKKNKKARGAWIEHPATQHQVYSAFEGWNPKERIAEPRGAEEGNPPLRLHAFVADYDCEVSEGELASGIGRIALTPNYYERTLSGYARLVWLFEKPISFPNGRFAAEFMALALQRGRFDQVVPALDVPAWNDPKRYYTNSCDWSVCDEHARVPFDLLSGWVLETSEKHAWKKDRAAVDIPLPIIFAEIEKRWPSHGWPGDFTEGSMGPSFWLPASTSPKSAIVKPTGMFTFSANAVKPFYGWADLLGVGFVEQYQTEAMGKAVKDIYHDGVSYWRLDGPGKWKPFRKEDIVGHLVVTRGLDDQKQGGEPSQVSRAVQFVQDWQGIDGAAPFVFQPSGLIDRFGARVLNISSRRALTPSNELGSAWGPAGKFPWLSAFFDGLFDPVVQKDYFLSWLHRFYAGAYKQELENGQNVFLLGKPNVGKTFITQGLLKRLMGGAAEAESYLMGETTFNSELFEVGLWTVDDNSSTADGVTHRKFSAMVKKMAANTTFSYHAKFRVPCSVEWRGRLFITANDDMVSASIVPDLSISVLDKIMLFRASDRPGVEFPDMAGCNSILDRELPHLARYLLEYEIPKHLLGSSRYGVLPYHDRRLLITADQSSSTSSFEEVVDLWAEQFFDDHQDLKCWEGTAAKWLAAVHNGDAGIANVLKNISVYTVGRQLAALDSKGCSYLTSRLSAGVRIWKISRPTRPSSSAPEALPVGNSFHK
jgi:hypothetical protein